MAVDALRNCGRRTRMLRWSRAAHRRTFRAFRSSKAADRVCGVVGKRDADDKDRRPTTESAAAAVAALRALPDSSEAAVQDAMEARGGAPVDAGSKPPTCEEETEDCASAVTPKPRRVHFSEVLDTVIQVTPYSEVYGIHPRLFVFSRNYYMVPAGGQYGFVDLPAAAEVDKSLDVDGAASESDGDDSDDGEWEPPVLLHFC